MSKFFNSLKIPAEYGSPEWRVAVIRRTLYLLTCALLFATLRLWNPQQEFPQIPLFASFGKIPGAVQGGIFALAACSLMGRFLLEVFLPKRESSSRCLLLCFALSMLLLFCMDQHRLQPWAYQAVLMFLVLGSVRARRGLTLLRLLTLSIYFYSALSKLDYTFLHSMGQQFTDTLLNLVGIGHWQWPEAIRLLAALTFPVGELIVAVMLAVPRARKLGVYAALFMHGLLLLVLGPWGMNQQAAVLIWNVQFMLLAVLLFSGMKKRETSEDEEQRAATTTKEASEPQPESAPESVRTHVSWLSKPVQGLVLLAILMPLLEPLGYWDHWLAWGLYSPGASKAQVFLHTSDVEHLPNTWQKFAQADKNDPNWVQIRTDLWSLEELAVPIYPQARFQLGVAAAVSEKIPPDHDAWIVVSGAADRFTGKRKQETIKTRPQLDTALDHYWLNARPVAR